MNLSQALQRDEFSGLENKQAHAMLLGPGEPIVDQDVRRLVDLLATLYEADGKKNAADSLASKGITPRAKWEELGLSEEPTIEAIAEARSVNAEVVRKVAFILAAKRIIENLNEGMIDTVEAAKEAIAAEGN